MSNLQREGATVPFTVPAGGLSSKGPVLVGTSLLIAAKDYEAGETGQGFSENVHDDIPAATGTAFDNLAPLYWDGDKLVNAPGSDPVLPFVGLAFGGKLTASATCSIKLVPSE